MFQMAQPITNAAQGSTRLGSTHGDLALWQGRTQKSQRVPALECVELPMLVPMWAKWQGQAGGRCCARGQVGGGTDLWLQAGTGSGTGWGHAKAVLGQLARGHPQLGCWQPVESGWHSTPGDRSSVNWGRAAHRGEDPGHPYSLQQREAEGGFGGSTGRGASQELGDQPSSMPTTC